MKSILLEIKMNIAKESKYMNVNGSSCRIVASTFGILVGLAGIMHGIFEILQCNTSPNDLLSEAIGPSQRF